MFDGDNGSIDAIEPSGEGAVDCDVAGIVDFDFDGGGGHSVHYFVEISKILE